MTSSGPYARAAWAYREAGWRGVLPLPAGAKYPPPGGFTGWAGVDPSGADVQAWCDGPESAGNIALRLPSGVYGLDVDAYGGKAGGAALEAAERNLGPLPVTWQVSARDDGVSGIRLFRAQLAPGRRWRDEPAGHGKGIEAIHLGHRYAVVWPSVHPDTGTEYVWYRPDGGGIAGPDEVPRLDRPDRPLPELPDAWIEALSEPGEVASGEAASHADTLAAVSGFVEDDPCTRVREAAARGLERLRAARDGAALHPAGRDATHELVALGHEGHSGARRALAEHYGAFTAVRLARGTDQRAAEGEWWRLVRGAVGKLVGPARMACDCALLAGAGVQFDAGLYIPPFGHSGVIPAVDQGLNALTSANPSPPGMSESDNDPSGGEGGAGGLVDVLGARLLTAEQVRAVRPPTVLVDGLLTLDSESWLIAKPGSYKTFVALDLAGHVGTGKPWMGRAVTHGEVLYLLAEGAGGMGRRVQAWEQRNGPMTGVRFLPVPVQVAREDHWAALVELARRIRPVMVVLDTQARITVGLQENDNSDMGRLIEGLGQLRRSTGACVLTVHHLGRGGEHARGASAIDGAQDSELRLTRTADFRVVLQTDKQRHLPDDARVELELFSCELDDGGTSLVVGAPLGVAVDFAPWREGLAENQTTIVNILHDHFDVNGGTRAEVAAVLRERGQWGKPGYRRTTFYDAWNELDRSGRIEKIHGTQRFVLVTQSSPESAGR